MQKSLHIKQIMSGQHVKYQLCNRNKIRVKFDFNSCKMDITGCKILTTTDLHRHYKNISPPSAVNQSTHTLL